MEFGPVKAIAVQVNAVSAGSEERYCTPIKSEDRRSAPTRGDVKCLVARLWNLPFGYESIDNLVYGVANRVYITVRAQLHPVFRHSEDIRKSAQCVSVVPANKPYPICPGN
jgi:hypothetical protein